MVYGFSMALLGIKMIEKLDPIIHNLLKSDILDFVYIRIKAGNTQRTSKKYLKTCDSPLNLAKYYINYIPKYVWVEPLN